MITYKELDPSTVYFTEVIEETTIDDIFHEGMTIAGFIRKGTDAWDELDHTLVVKETDLERTTKLQDKESAIAQLYISRTDWYIIRQVETGEAAPAEILTARAEARAKVI